MTYYKHSRLMRDYGVADRTVRNWVEASLAGKVDLKLEQHNGRHYVAQTISNETVLAALAEKGKKYRNSRSQVTVKPDVALYQDFAPSQVADLLNSVDKDRRISWSYTYVGQQSASRLDAQLMDLHGAGTGNQVTNTIELLRHNFGLIERRIAGYDHVNLVVVCPGNGVVVHDLIARVKSLGKLHRLVAVDISQAMLDTMEYNIERWFDGSVQLERQVVDIRFGRPADLLEDATIPEAGQVISLVCVVGDTLSHFEEPGQVLRNLGSTLTKDDLLITTMSRSKADDDVIDPYAKPGQLQLNIRYRRLLDLMGIDKSLYEVVRRYDEVGRQMVTAITFQTNVTLDYAVAGYRKKIVFEKGESLLVGITRHFSDSQVTDLLTNAAYQQLLTAQSDDGQMLLTVSKPEASAKMLEGLI